MLYTDELIQIHNQKIYYCNMKIGHDFHFKKTNFSINSFHVLNILSVHHKLMLMEITFISSKTFYKMIVYIKLSTYALLLNRNTILIFCCKYFP